MGCPRRAGVGGQMKQAPDPRHLLAQTRKIKTLMVPNSPGSSPKVRPSRSLGPRLQSALLRGYFPPASLRFRPFFFFLLILNNGISVCLGLNHVDPPSFPFLFIQSPNPPSSGWVFFTFSPLKKKNGEKKNFPRSRKLIIADFDFQSLPGWSDENPERKRKRRN